MMLTSSTRRVSTVRSRARFAKQHVPASAEPRSWDTANDMADGDDSVILRFYDGFADDYHLAYGGEWDAASERQGASLDRLIRDALPDARAILDCSCGIGTQALGLA